MTLSRTVRLANFASLPTLLALAACGAAPAPAAVSPTGTPAAPVAVAPPDLSAVPEPEGLIVFARANKPSEALKVIGGWVGMPMPGAEEAGGLVAGQSIGNVVDLDQPIDFAIALKGRSQAGAISAAVRSLDEAKAAFAKFKLVAGDNGAWRIEGLGEPAGDDKERDVGEARVCELVPSFGPSTTRLICGDSEASIQRLAPWLSRSAPRLTFPADAHLDIRLAPLRETVTSLRRALPMLIGGALGIRHSALPEIDEAFRAGVDDLADFTSDCDTIAFDAMLGEPQGTVTVTSQFRSSTSLMARLALGHPERADAPPASFWKLPADTDMAFFHRGIDATDFEHARDHLADVLGGSLGKEGLAEADRKAIREAATHALDLVTLKSTYGKGIDPDAAQKALAAIKAVKAGDDAAREEAERVAAEKMAGWFAVGIDAPASKVVANEKEWAAAWARPGVVKWVKTRSPDAPSPTLKVTAPPKSLGVKDASQLEISVYRPHPADPKNPKKAAAQGKPMVLHALVVPDGEAASWLIFAADPELAAAKAKEILAGGSKMVARPGLGAMKEAKMTSGGFLSARGFAEADPLTWTLAPDWHHLSRDVIGALASTPDKGTTPVPFQASSQPAGATAPAGSFSATFTVPKGAIESFVRLGFLHH